MDYTQRKNDESILTVCSILRLKYFNINTMWPSVLAKNRQSKQCSKLSYILQYLWNLISTVSYCLGALGKTLKPQVTMMIKLMFCVHDDLNETPLFL